jgi:membrane protein DedA with SNARE-associated domain
MSGLFIGVITQLILWISLFLMAYFGGQYYKNKKKRDLYLFMLFLLIVIIIVAYSFYLYWRVAQNLSGP